MATVMRCVQSGHGGDFAFTVELAYSLYRDSGDLSVHTGLRQALRRFVELRVRLTVFGASCGAASQKEIGLPLQTRK
jgi:hypothetical protein